MRKVCDFYSGKCVFVTGASGFLGMVLIEKLLRVCPQISCIIILMRPKRGQGLDERFEQWCKNRIFSKLLEEQPKAFDKVKVVNGDISELNLGLSDQDKALITSKADLIFHSAATLDFEASLTVTTTVNYLGTKQVLELAEKCTNLAAFVYVSSAYANSFRFDCREELYPLLTTPEDVLKLVRESNAEDVRTKTPGILQTHPNTYTFTKHMAEHVVAEFSNKFRCTIVRPSMKPIPGWTSSKNGPAGFFMGAQRGIIRRLPVDENLVYDYIPVDVVINTLVTAAFYVVVVDKKLEIFHCTSSTRNPFKWEKFKSEINHYLHKWPLASAVWYPNMKFLPSIERYKISAVFVHIIPSIILDTVLSLSGKKRILTRLHMRANESLNRLQKFIFNEWKFHCDNTDRLQCFIAEQDDENVIKFSVAIDELNWQQYMADVMLGVREYLNNERKSTLTFAKRKNTVFYICHMLLQMFIFFIFWMLISFFMDTKVYYWQSCSFALFVYVLFRDFI